MKKKKKKKKKKNGGNFENDQIIYIFKEYFLLIGTSFSKDKEYTSDIQSRF